MPAVSMPMTTDVRLDIRGPVSPCDLPGIRARARRLLTTWDPGRLVVDVTGVGADAVALDAVASVALEARRCGCTVHVQGVGRDFCELVALAGLAPVLGLTPG